MMKSAIAGNNGAIFEHIAAEELRVELERTREELHTVKKQLTDRDSELLQLKTAHRKLQDALRKKDKDLQNVFAVLRAPQDAELTKKRKTELVERLLTETQQRVVNAEAVAEERKRELDKFKFSSKFLRYQELEVEIEECHTEIERLRVELSQYAVVGKLKVSRAGLDANEKPKTPAKQPTRRSSGNQHSESMTMRNQAVTSSLQRTVQAVRPLPLQPAPKRESFVDKTRKAVELEYNKQLRLAELEAECELEENLRIRAKREAQAQAEARRRKSQQDAAKIRKTATEVPAATQFAETAVESVTRAETVTEDAPLAAIAVSTTASATARTVAGDGLQDSCLVAIDECHHTVNKPSADGTTAVEVSVAAVMEEVVNAVEHEPQPEVVETRESQQPKQYDEDDFDDGADDKDDDESASVVDEAVMAGEAVRQAQAVSPSGEDAVEEVADDDDVEDLSENKPKPVETPQQPVVHEVYEEEDELEEVVDKQHDGNPAVHAQSTARGGSHRQGFVVSADPTEEQEEAYEPLASEHKQGFVVDPTYDSEEFIERAAEGDRAKTAGDSAGEGEEVRSPEEEEAKSEDPVELVRPVEVVEPVEAGDDDTAATETKERQISHDAPAEVPATETNSEDATTHAAAAIEHPKEETHEDPGTRPEACPEEIQKLTPVDPNVKFHEQEGTVHANAEHEPTHSAAPDEDATQLVFVDEDTARKKDGEATMVTDDSPYAEHATVAMVSVHADPPAEDVHTVEQALHDCDDAIDAATATIHRQINDALAEAAAPPTTTSETSSSPLETSTSSAELTASEMAAAMDSAARKIQRFWREMERKYAPNPAAMDTSTTATPRRVHSGESTPMESAESPVVSETDGW